MIQKQMRKKKYLEKYISPEQLLDDTTNQPSKFRTKFGLKQMMNHEEHIITIVTLNLKFQ